MSKPRAERVTLLLAEIDQGNDEAARQLFPVVYAELRRLARRLLARERATHTLQATALVHEAFLKLVKKSSVGFRDRIHFFGVASLAMRRILVDHARARRRAKRSGSLEPLPLDATVASFEARALDLIALDEALEELAKLDSRKARLVELRFFGGLDSREAAALLAISHRTAEREWTVARAFLRRRLGDDRKHD